MQDLYPDYLVDDCDPKLYQCLNEQEESTEVTTEKVESKVKVESEDLTESKDKTEPECQDPVTNGQSYRGKESKANNGKPCIPWDTVAWWADYGLSGNWCRNPDKGTRDTNKGVWCFVEQPVDGQPAEGSWEYCKVPWC